MAQHHPTIPTLPRSASIIIAADPLVGLECPICLSQISLSTRANMTKCTHSFHRTCIAEWHAQQRQQTRNTDCPVCRTPGTAADHEWPTFRFSGSVWGPWGSIAITPDIIIINARYWFSQPTKHLIRYSDIARYYRNRNCIFFVDALGEVIISFSVRDPQKLFETLAIATVQHYERYGRHLRTVVPLQTTIVPTANNNVSNQNNGMHYEP